MVNEIIGEMPLLGNWMIAALSGHGGGGGAGMGEFFPQNAPHGAH